MIHFILCNGGKRLCPPWLGSLLECHRPSPTCPLDLEATWSQVHSLLRFKNDPSSQQGCGNPLLPLDHHLEPGLGSIPGFPGLMAEAFTKAKNEHRTVPGAEDRGHRNKAQNTASPQRPLAQALPTSPGSADPGAGRPFLTWGSASSLVAGGPAVS